MPFIQIRSLPLPESLNVRLVIEGLSKEFAEGADIGLEHVTATWEFLLPGHYAVAGRAVEHQPQDSHPVLVDVLVPDFNSDAAVEKMLVTVASSIARLATVPRDNIFINLRQAHSGMVFDGGQIVRW